MPEEKLQRAAEQYADHFCQFNVVAVVDTLDHAREALSTLQRGGIEASSTSLLGPAAERAEADVNENERDAGVVGEVARGTALGTAMGGTAGGLAGFLGGLAAFAIPGIGPAIGTGVWVSTIGGAVLGGGVGGMLGGVSSINAGDSWDLTYELQQGHALVGVHSDDAETVTRARALLTGDHILAIGELDEQGRRVDGQ